MPERVSANPFRRYVIQARAAAFLVLLTLSGFVIAW
jgi:hypothetical protein